ncbi:hypothetical protein Gotur_003807 [Gossypium turneri]
MKLFECNTMLIETIRNGLAIVSSVAEVR